MVAKQPLSSPDSPILAATGINTGSVGGSSWPLPAALVAAAAGGMGNGDVFDEMVSGEGGVRLHWRAFLATLGLNGEGPAMDDRWEAARRLLRQNGVTYNIYGDPQGMERPWPLDLVPLLLSAEEWRVIAAGAEQRARLLNTVLADLYGPQTLIRTGRIPPALVFDDPAFLRPCHGLRLPGGVHLHLVAFDLARLPDGGWSVLADRTDTPSGTGYVLENRFVTREVLADCFRVCNVDRLPPFFQAFGDHLATAMPGRAEPRVVLLTPGPYNETYFEHVFLAQHLGLTLVEGADLVVRDRRVFLKTLNGLESVDVILRRLDENFCDPLELRADSTLGVAGLVEAIRAGNVVVANALGSGVVESMAFKPYLPSICRDMLGEEPILAQVESLWCGEPQALSRVAGGLDTLVIKPSRRGMPYELTFGAELDASGREELLTRLRQRPADYVAQERVDLSTAPTWREGRLQACPIVLRVYVAAKPGGGYAVMPGGLTRFANHPGSLVVSMQHGGGSKDTWVLRGREADETDEAAVAASSTTVPGWVAAGAGLPVQAAGESRAAQSLWTPRVGRESGLPSRVTDSLFWAGRYAERCEGTVRLLRGAHIRLADGQHSGVIAELAPLFRLMTWFGLIPVDLANTAERRPSRTLRSALHAAVFDPAHPCSLRANIQRLHRVAYTVRDRLSVDLWRVIEQIDRHSQPPAIRSDGVEVLLCLDELVTSFAALTGLQQESMTRGPGWRFLNIGCRLERASFTAALLSRGGMTDPEIASGERLIPTLDVLLELCVSFMAYRERHLSTARRQPVLELLLADETNPRSLAFQLSRLAEHLIHLPQTSGGLHDGGPVHMALELIARARALLAHRELTRSVAVLRSTLDEIAVSLPEVSNLLTHAYFNHAFARSA